MRELYGVVHDRRSASAKLIATSRFTPDAVAFAKSKPIELVDANALLHLLRGVQASGEDCSPCSEPRTRSPRVSAGEKVRRGGSPRVRAGLALHASRVRYPELRQQAGKPAGRTGWKPVFRLGLRWISAVSWDAGSLGRRLSLPSPSDLLRARGPTLTQRRRGLPGSLLRPCCGGAWRGL